MQAAFDRLRFSLGSIECWIWERIVGPEPDTYLDHVMRVSRIPLIFERRSLWSRIWRR